jgi:O-antigen ligase
VRAAPLKQPATNPWLWICVAVVVIVVAAALAPVATTLAVLGAVAVVFLVWRFGTSRGLWYLVLLTLPLKEPLSFDVHGTVSVCVTDFVLVLLFLRVLAATGLRTLWNRSVSFRLEVAILVMSVVGLYTATRLFWGVAGVYRLMMLTALFVVGRVLVRDRDEAVRSLFFVCLSLIVPAIFGVYQAALPFGTELPDWGGTWTAYDAFGKPTHRVFSTLNHPLNLSHYLTVGFALCLGLAVGMRRARTRVALVCVAALAAFCNLYTYSAGGIVGVVAAVAALVLLVRSGRLLAVAVAALVAAAFLAPPALVAKVERLFSGEAVTAAARLVTYKQAFMIIRDHPLVGLGWGGIRTSLEGVYRVSRADAVAFTAENYFLQRAIALGLVGVGLYSALWLRFIGNVRRLTRSSPASSRFDPLTVALIAGATAFAAQAQVMPATNVSTNSILWLMFAIAESLALRGESVGGES